MYTSVPESAVLTLRLDAKLKKQLDRLSKSMSRSRSFVAAQAIEEYVSVNEWQIAEIRRAWPRPTLATCHRRGNAADDPAFDATCARRLAAIGTRNLMAVSEYVARTIPMLLQGLLPQL